MIAEKAAFNRAASDLDQRRRIPAVPAQQRYRNAQLTGLTRNQTGFIIITARKNRVRLARLDRRQLRLKIFVARTVALLASNRPTILGKIFFEILRQSNAVILLSINKNGHFLPAARNGKFSHHRPLKRVNKTHPKNIVARLRHFGIGRSRRNHRHPSFLANRPHLQRPTRSHLPQHRHYLVTRNQLFRHRAGLTLLRLIIFRHQSHLLAQQSARHIDLGHSHFSARIGRCPKRRRATGQSRHFSNDNVPSRIASPALLFTASQAQHQCRHGPSQHRRNRRRSKMNHNIDRRHRPTVRQDGNRPEVRHPLPLHPYRSQHASQTRRSHRSPAPTSSI